MSEVSLSPETLPYEVQTIILRFAVGDILFELCRSDSTLPYTVRLRQWLHLRLTCKTFDNVLAQLMFDGVPIHIWLRRKQCEKLDYVLEALQISADMSPVNTHVSLPKLKRLCGKFWHNPDLSVLTVQTVISLLQSPQSLNFAVKLEPWILRHRRRSEQSSVSRDNVLFFDYGDWVVDAGVLQIRRVSRWQSGKGTKIGMYLTHEAREPVTSVHVRLGHDRRWYLEHLDASGRIIIQCMVNYKTKMVWDHMRKQLYDFEGQQYEFAAEEEDMESEDDDGDEQGDDDDGGGDDQN
jgi:hypothetical protein